VHALIFKFLEKPPVSVLPEFEKAKAQLDIIDKYILTATPTQRERLMNLRCRIAAAKDHIGMNNRFNDPQWTELPDVMQSWARNFTHRVTDISSLGNVMSSQNRFVQLNYLPKEQEVRQPMMINAPLHPVVISAPASTFAGQPAPVTVRVLDSHTYKSVSATLHWRQAGEPNWKSAPMARRVKAIFTLDVPAAGLVEYYLTITDGNSSVRWPVTANRSIINIGKAPVVPQAKPLSVKIDNQTISWKATTGAFWYRIYRSNKPDFKPGPENFVTYVPASMLSFIDGAPGFDGKPLSGNQFYRITAVDKAGNESVASESVNIAARMH